jgi:hypothetical protein
MKNKLGFMGLLGFLGIIGIVTDNQLFLAFFAFFVFFRYFFVKPDELFKLNVRRAATPSFFIGVVIQVLIIAAGAFTDDLSYLVAGYSLSFIIPVFLFILLLVIYELREQRNR